MQRRVVTLALFLLVPAAQDARAAKKAVAPPPPPPRGEKLARLLELEDRRSAGGDELAQLLRDPDRGLRRRAALAAGRVADPALVPGLVALMDDAEVEVRRMAAFALGLAGDRAAVDRLLAALADPDAVVRGRAAEALGRIGEVRATPPIARLVVDALPKTISRMTVRGDDPGNPNDAWAEQRLALFALARLKDTGAAREALLDGGRPRFDWWAATWVAARLESPELRPVLLAAAASDDPRSRALAARGLGALKDPSAVELLLGLVRDPDEAVTLQALRALGAIGDARGTAVAAAMLASASDVVRHEALRALGVLPPDPSLRQRLVSLVAERDPWIRSAALSALARTDRADFALVLSGMDPDETASCPDEKNAAHEDGPGGDLEPREEICAAPGGDPVPDDGADCRPEEPGREDHGHGELASRGNGEKLAQGDNLADGGGKTNQPEGETEGDGRSHGAALYHSSAHTSMTREFHGSLFLRALLSFDQDSPCKPRSLSGTSLSSSAAFCRFPLTNSGYEVIENGPQ
jgi:HEAT repeat protein